MVGYVRSACGHRTRRNLCYIYIYYLICIYIIHAYNNMYLHPYMYINGRCVCRRLFGFLGASSSTTGRLHHPSTTTFDSRPETIYYFHASKGDGYTLAVSVCVCVCVWSTNGKSQKFLISTEPTNRVGGEVATKGPN